MPCKLSCVNQKVIVAVENLKQNACIPIELCPPIAKNKYLLINVLCFFANNESDKCNKID